MAQRNEKTRILSMALAVLMAGSSILPSAAAPAGGGVLPTYDEAYYATLDYYGGLMEGSVVKSYALNGASSLTDYGAYDEVVNLTDGTPAVIGTGTTAFRFDQAPSRFYFEGKTARPFQELPWTISLRYTLNGVPVRAEELAGKTGVVEILLDIVPNEKASDYARYNYTLEAMAIFNQDDILSLEAPGAQVQLVGNLRTVLFLALPGEEQHFTIRVGSDDFSFGGMTFLMVPATLAQLEEIAKLSQRKDDLEEDYRALSGSLDDLLDALSSIQGGLYASANGLDQLDIARSTISNGKGLLYDEAGVLRMDLSGIADLLEPVEGRMQALSQTISDAKGVLTSLTDTTVSLKDQLKDLESALRALEDGTGDVKRLMRTAADMEDSLDRLKRALDGTSIGGGDIGSSKDLVEQVKTVHRAYEAAQTQSRENFFIKMLMIQGEDKASAEEKAAKAAPLAEALAGGATEDQIVEAQTMKIICGMGLGVTQDTYQEFITSEQGQAVYAQVRAKAAEEIGAQLPSVKALEALYSAAKGGMTFQQFCEKLPGVSKEQAKQMNDLWIVYNSGPLADGTSEELAGTAPAMGGAALAGAVRPGTGILSAALASAAPGSADMSGGESGEGGPSGQPGAEEDGAAAEPEPPASEDTGAGEDLPAGDGTGDPAGKDTAGESGTVGGAVVDLITGGLDSASSQLNKIQSQLSEAMDKVARPTAAVVGDLADLCEQLDDLTDLLDDAEDLSAALRRSTEKIQTILEDVDDLREVLDAYEPTLQEGIANVGRISTSAVTVLRDLETLLGDTESLMKTSGAQLDSGTQQTLRGLSAALRQTAQAMAAVDGVRDAKTTITDIVEDTWHEYTGDVNNILMMDAGAEPVSLTDPRNPSPSSVQVLIRTQEIKVEEAPAEVQAAAAKAETTFWGRIVQMFRDFWTFITGIFR
ncbi:hypothetical protein D7V91_03645 [bacterium 1xD42-67]|nr:hypothetical protein D7V91_03645 [bacterium 1xD42-67]